MTKQLIVVLSFVLTFVGTAPAFAQELAIPAGENKLQAIQAIADVYNLEGVNRVGVELSDETIPNEIKLGQDMGLRDLIASVLGPNYAFKIDEEFILQVGPKGYDWTQIEQEWRQQREEFNSYTPQEQMITVEEPNGFVSLSANVLAPSIDPTQPTWLDHSVAREAARTAYERNRPSRYYSGGFTQGQGYYPGSVLSPSAYNMYGGNYWGGGYGNYYPWMTGCSDTRPTSYLEFKYRGARGEKHLWLVSINGVGPGTVDQADTLGQKLAVCSDAAVVVTVEKIGDSRVWTRQYSLRPFTSTEVPVGEFLFKDTARVTP
ncbi:MAG: hypothetical protein Q8P83_04020 [bacterium]|nr:hypothetical protein [bacterium]